MALWLLATALPAASPLPTARKTVRSYALTSGNDFPQRDPQDWRLLGSNDEGKTWTTLDTRRGEAFQHRHQRRVFLVTTPGAYQTYRLQVDRVKDPRAANTVQLAEVEVLGEGQQTELNPALTDTISAQGDNPPSETVSKLFDGKVETKWLDQPVERSTCASWVQWKYASADQALVTNLVSLSRLRARAADDYPVTVEAFVVNYSPETKRLCVVDGSACLDLGGIELAEPLLPGQRVSLSGVSAWSSNAPALKAPRVEILTPAPAAQPEPLELAEMLEPGSELRWVKIEGQVEYVRREPGGVSFDLEGHGSRMRVYFKCAPDDLEMPASGERVAVHGLCGGAFNGAGEWVASQLYAAGTGSLETVDVQSGSRPQVATNPLQPATPPAPATLTKIEQIRRLSQEQLQARPRVRVRGVITHLLGGFVQDETGGIQVAYPSDEARKLTEPGTFIEIDGWGGLGDVGSPVISADHVKVLGKGKLPEPERLSLTQLISGRMDAQWVEMEGVVRSTDGAHLLMLYYGREVMASVSSAAAESVKQLVDAAVRVRGVGVTALDDRGRIQGMHLLIPSLEHIDVVEPPPNPASLQVRPIGSLLGLNGPRESAHRVKVEGVVTLQEDNKFYLQDDSGGAMAILKEEVVLDPRFGRSRWLFWRADQTNNPARAQHKLVPGQKVQVIGFPETRGYSPVLTEATVIPLAGNVGLTAFPASRINIGDGRLDSALISFQGVLLGQNPIGNHIVMALQWEDRTIQVLAPVSAAQLTKIVPGSKLQVVGVCQVDSSPVAELGRRVAAVRVLARSAEDITVLSKPSWWTLRRAAGAMSAMALLMIAALLWIRQLRRQVEERTRQLAEEIRLREQTERQRALEQERSRIAKDLHDDLGANLAQIVFLSHRVEGGRQESQEVERWFRLIPATARRTIQSLDEIVWAINPRHDSLESLANYLSQFAQQHLSLAGIRCVLEVPMVLPAIIVGAEVRHNVVLAAREAIHNVVTHARPTEVRISLQLNEAYLLVEIADNGHGFDCAKLNGDGNGVPNMRRRLEDVGGRLVLESTPGRGTTVRLEIPRGVLHGRVIAAPTEGKSF